MNTQTRNLSLELQRYYKLPGVRVSLTLVLSIFIVAVFIVFALKPTLTSIVALKKNIKESEETLSALETKVSTLKTISNEYETLKPLLPKFDRAIPNNEVDYNSITKDIELVAQQTGVKIGSQSLGSTILFSRLMSPFKKDKNQDVITLPFNIKITGSYPQISTFIKKIFSMERLIQVESIGIIQANAAQDKGQNIEVDIAGSVFYLANKEQIKLIAPDQKGK